MRRSVNHGAACRAKRACVTCSFNFLPRDMGMVFTSNDFPYQTISWYPPYSVQFSTSQSLATSSQTWYLPAPHLPLGHHLPTADPAPWPLSPSHHPASNPTIPNWFRYCIPRVTPCTISLSLVTRLNCPCPPEVAAVRDANPGQGTSSCLLSN